MEICFKKFLFSIRKVLLDEKQSCQILPWNGLSNAHFTNCDCHWFSREKNKIEKASSDKGRTDTTSVGELEKQISKWKYTFINYEKKKTYQYVRIFQESKWFKFQSICGTLWGIYWTCQRNISPEIGLIKNRMAKKVVTE